MTIRDKPASSDSSDRNAFNIEAAASEQAGYTLQDAGLIVYKNGNRMFQFIPNPPLTFHQL